MSMPLHCMPIPTVLSPWPMPTLGSSLGDDKE